MYVFNLALFGKKMLLQVLTRVHIRRYIQTDTRDTFAYEKKFIHGIFCSVRYGNGAVGLKKKEISEFMVNFLNFLHPPVDLSFI